MSFNFSENNQKFKQKLMEIIVDFIDQSERKKKMKKKNTSIFINEELQPVVKKRLVEILVEFAHESEEK